MADTHSVASSGAHHKNLYEDIYPYCRRQKCRPMTLVSGGITFVRIFVGFPGRGRQTTVVLLTMAISSVFDDYFFGYFRNEASVIIW